MNGMEWASGVSGASGPAMKTVADILNMSRELSACLTMSMVPKFAVKLILKTLFFQLLSISSFVRSFVRCVCQARYKSRVVV